MKFLWCINMVYWIFYDKETVPENNSLWHHGKICVVNNASKLYINTHLHLNFAGHNLIFVCIFAYCYATTADQHRSQLTILPWICSYTCVWWRNRQTQQSYKAGDEHGLVWWRAHLLPPKFRALAPASWFQCLPSVSLGAQDFGSTSRILDSSFSC